MLQNTSWWMKCLRRTVKNEVYAKVAGSCFSAAVYFTCIYIMCFAVQSACALAYGNEHCDVQNMPYLNNLHPLVV